MIVNARGLSLRALGAQARTSHTTAGRVLDGHPTSPRVATAIARVLGRPVGDLFIDVPRRAERAPESAAEAGPRP